MYNFSIGGSKKDPYNFQIGGSSSETKQKGFGLTGSLSKTGGLTGGLTSSLMSSQTKKASSLNSSGGFGEVKSSTAASKSAQSAVTNTKTPAAATGSSKGGKSHPPSKKNAKSKFGEDIIPRRFGLRYDPPTIIIEYMVPNSGKLYHHKMKLRKLQKDTDIEDALEYLKKKHETYLSDESISDQQLTSLVERLKKRLSSGPASKPASKAKVEPIKKSSSLAPLGNNDFKPPSAGSSALRGVSSSISGGLNQIRSSSANAMGKENSSVSTKASFLRGRDKEEEQEEEEEEEDVFKYAWNKKGAGSIQNSKMSKQVADFDYDYDDEDEEEQEQGYNDEDDEEEEEEDDEIDYNTYNLNKLSNQELQKHKDKMENTFKKNSLRPGDKGYQYNVQEEFDPEESNEWDDDEEEE